MKLILIVTFFFLLLSPFCTRAQNEAAVWAIGNGKQFNFQSGSFQYLDFNGNPSVNATICDKEGNVVLSTNGDTVWNRNNEILVNGTGLVEKDYLLVPNSKPIFIPYPEKEGHYLLIYTYGQWTIDKNRNYIYKDKKMAYAEIDINANNGRGEIVTKQNVILADSKQNPILTDFGSVPTVAGFCYNSYYWMVIPYYIPYSDNGVDKSVLLFYKIDKNGISTEPIANTYFPFGSFNSLQFSPNGDKMYIFHIPKTSTSFEEQGLIADFNFLTGELYNYRPLEYYMYSKVTFSPNSRFLYYNIRINRTVNGEVVERRSEIVQLDVRYVNNITQTRTVILDLLQNSDIGWAGDLNLAPDGKIYFSYYDNLDGKYKLARINRPNNKGLNCDLEFDVATIPVSPRPLEFVTSFFRDKSLDNFDEIDANAGPDKQLCPLSEIKLGNGAYYQADLYQWYPDQYLDDPFLSQPTFSAPSQGNITRTFPQVLRVTDKNCWINFDTTNVTVLPKPNKANIDGSWSVCPYVGEVDYWVNGNDNSLQWFVNGGEIVTDNTLDTIKISWWDINTRAAAKVLATNESGCVSDTAVFPVRINPELITQPPIGQEDMCIADAKAATYWIKGTHGSVYEWIADGGEIIDGQGTNKVIVNWKKEGSKKIFVRETSVTTDTVCYGESDPLEVNVLNDSIEINLDYVSFDLQNKLEVHYSSDKFDVHKQTLTQYAENVDNGIIEEFHPLNTGLTGYYIYQTKPEESGSQIINLEVINRCDETFLSGYQQTIVLHGDIFPEQKTISLRWNLNQFWENDRLKHEIWHSVDGKNNWELIATVNRQTAFEYQYPDVSLYHYMRVKEINVDKNFESWSNTIEFQVSDILKIPDVFTPNGDGYNDVWEIWNIDSYIFKNLIVYNKSGEPVYKCKNGYKPWDGKINGKIYQGTYFYEISFEGYKTRYGQVTVLQ